MTLIPRIYLETSVVNMYFDDHAVKQQECTKRLFDEIKNGSYLPFVSDYVMMEIERAEHAKREKMLRLLDDFAIGMLSQGEKDIELAEEYIRQGVIPENT